MTADAASRVGLGLVEAERLAGGDPQLVGHEIPAGDQLGHRMLHLEPGVHLEEVVAAIVVEEELAGAGRAIADRPGEGQGRLAELLPKAFANRRRRALLEDLLVATLE